MPAQPTSIKVALKKKTDADFIQTLQLINTNQYDAYYERPEMLGRVWGLAAFQRTIAHGGMRAFLDLEEGQSFHETEGWCRDVGATKAAAWLAATGALFPNGKVPRNDDRRYTAAEKIVKATGDVQPGPFQKLDRKYASAVEDLGKKLRKYVEKHLDEIELAIDESFDPAPPTKAERRAEKLEEKKQLKRLDRALKAADAIEKKEAAALKKAVARMPKTADPAMVAFIDALIGLSLVQWEEVVARYDKLGKRARDFSSSEIDSLRFDGQMARLDHSARFTARVKAALAERDRVKEKALVALPVEGELGGRTIPFRAAAAFATHAAWGAIQVHEWVTGVPSLEKAARTAYAPFKGFAPLPAFPVRAKKSS